MGRKVFISILGSGPYSECTYTDDTFSYQTRYIQVATLKNILAKSAEAGEPWTSKDAAVILLTDKAQSEQWLVGMSKEGKEAIKRTGLKTILDEEKFPLQIISKPIPDGKNEEEIWEIFDTIFASIEEGDELYFDITHAFRYLPMMLLVLINYSKFLKSVKVKSITYGNFMVPGDNKPIMDLTSLSTLQDWTFAAGQYLDSGNVNKLVEISRQELKPILKKYKGSNTSASAINGFIGGLEKVVSERMTCRGISIIKSDSLRGLKKYAGQIEESIIKPLTPIIEKIKCSLESFDEEENAKNGFAAARWCYDNGLYQQAATILQEFVVTFFCMRHGIEPADETRREIVNQAFILNFNHQAENIGENWSRVKEENKPTLASVLSDELFECSELVNLFNNLTEVRNDFNHSGMRSKKDPLAPKNIKENIKKCIDGFGVLLFSIDYNTNEPC